MLQSVMQSKKNPTENKPQEKRNQQNKIMINEPCSETNRINREHFHPHQVSYNFKESKPHAAEPQRPIFYPSVYVHQQGLCKKSRTECD